MLNLLNQDLQAFLIKKIYKYRYLTAYILIGFLSIVVELIFCRATLDIIPLISSQICSVSPGILLAFVLNVRFNFKVPKSKRIKSLIYFSLISSISSISYMLNNLLYTHIITLGVSYEGSRPLSSALLFFIGYYFHRKYSFKNYKKVGVAIYANGKEDIKQIWGKLQSVGDFIHVDILEKNFNSNAPVMTIDRIETIKAYWPKKELHCHLMSKTPSKLINKIINYADTIIIRYEINEKTIGLIQSEKIISGSFILNGKNPIRQIMLLQTSGQYEVI